MKNDEATRASIHAKNGNCITTNELCTFLFNTDYLKKWEKAI